VPVVDAASLLGAPQSNAGRFVTVRIDGRRAALAVETIIGLVEIPPDSISALPPLLSESPVDVVSALGALDRELFYVLNTARIVPGPVWATLGRQKSDV
jgi:chemotaxis signal transduction protein